MFTKKKLTQLGKILFFNLIFNSSVNASNTVPIGHDNNVMYYKVGGASDFSLPPVSETDSISLDSNANLGAGYNCTAYNPALSIKNTLNNLKDSSDNITRDILTNATASLLLMPGYALAKQNPTLYALFNNYLLSSHRELDVTTKNCETVKNQIAQNQNPYQDWGTIAAGDQWKKSLSLTADGTKDINQARKEIDAHTGESGVPWVKGNTDPDGTIRAGGKGQPPVNAIADTTKAGYNALLNRNLESDDNAPTSGQASELAANFKNPQAAQKWIVSVVGDQTITTYATSERRKQQGSVVGHGLLPWITSCKENQNDCAPNIREKLGKLVIGNEPITKENLEFVSADGIAISPDIISSIRTMDKTQESIIVNKLAQEIAVQRVVNKALIAKHILTTGSQVPAIAANHPAQVIIARAITSLDNDIRSIVFESDMRKQMVSGTLSEIMNYSTKQKERAMAVPQVSPKETVMENGALPFSKGER